MRIKNKDKLDQMDMMATIFECKEQTWDDVWIKQSTPLGRGQQATCSGCSCPSRLNPHKRTDEVQKERSSSRDCQTKSIRFGHNSSLCSSPFTHAPRAPMPQEYPAKVHGVFCVTTLLALKLPQPDLHPLACTRLCGHAKSFTTFGLSTFSKKARLATN